MKAILVFIDGTICDAHQRHSDCQRQQRQRQGDHVGVQIRIGECEKWKLVEIGRASCRERV
jgi:hypothetical protein